MGFRSGFITDDMPVTWPAWFKEKYANRVHFPETGMGSISSKTEGKTYSESGYSELHTDIQKALREGWDLKEYGEPAIVLLYLHECGGVTRCEIGTDEMTWSEPLEWFKSDGINHHYCYRCSDPKDPLVED